MRRLTLSDESVSHAASGSARELGEATLAGIRWISGARAAAEVTAFASSLVLARLIPPADFGRAVIALLPIWLAVALNTNGIAASLVQLRSIRRAHLEAAASTALVLGGVLTLASALLAPAVAAPLFGARTAHLIHLTSPVWMLAGLSAVGQAMLQRRLDFRRIGFVEVAALLTGSTTAVALAVAGLDGESLVLGALTAVTVDGVLYLALGFLVRPRWNGAAARELASFSLPVAASSLVYTVFRNVDYAILGLRLSASQVGFYSRAFQLGVDYQAKVSTVMLRVAYPVYSRTESDEDMRALRTRIVRMHATILIPLLGALVALAPTVVPLLFGNQWQPSVFLTQILAFAGIAAALTTGRGPILLALGRAKALLALNVVELLFYAAVVFALAPYGLVAVAFGVVAFSFVTVLGTQFVLRWAIQIPVRQVVHDAGPALASTLAMLAVVFPLARTLEDASVPAIPLVLAVLSVGSAVYLLTLRLAFRATWREMSALARGLGRRRVSGVPTTSVAETLHAPAAPVESEPVR